MKQVVSIARNYGGFCYVQVVPELAQLGDDVHVPPASGVFTGAIGRVVGTSTQTDSLIVKWDAVPGCDVIGIGSPVWSQFTIYRNEPEQPETVETWRTAYQGNPFAHHDAIASVRGSLKSEPQAFENVYDGHLADSEPAEPPGTVKGPVITLPWSN